MSSIVEDTAAAVAAGDLADEVCNWCLLKGIVYPLVPGVTCWKDSVVISGWPYHALHCVSLAF